MVDSGLLAQRLRWARKEQGVTLQQLSERCGRAVSYLSQLEHGVKDNPTRQTVDALAHALGVRSAFLFGEITAERPTTAPPTIVAEFRKHLSELPAQRRQELAVAEPAARFAEIVSFLVWHHPESFTHIELAFQLGISYAYYREVTEQGAEVSHYMATQLARISGIPELYLTHGTFEAPAGPMETADALRYLAVIRLAQAHQLTPQDLERIILQATATR